ncbi:MAG TPA: hypothetical protein DCG66_03145 [Brevundimonas sp.]|nr:hypothetical protein [Brevundimonas sp.]RSB45251.1 hypothetical protein EGK63_08630 [Brevundimonas sp. 357]HAF79989.1 hypothetical protein [Brevundimonas sp.]
MANQPNATAPTAEMAAKAMMTRVPWVRTGRRRVRAAISRRAATRNRAIGKCTAAGCMAPSQRYRRCGMGFGPSSAIMAPWSMSAAMPGMAVMSDCGPSAVDAALWPRTAGAS